MTGFTNVFGGAPVQPSDIAYRAIFLNSNQTLTWPTSFVDTENVVARIMGVIPSGAGFSLTLPSAEEVSVGADFLVYNNGANNFNILLSDGSFLLTISPGIAWYVWLDDNTTIPGTWTAIQFGAGTSSATASALAGNGLVAITNLLNTNFPSKNIAANYTAVTADRAYLLVWTGGAGTITMPSPAALGYYLAVNNEGSGVVTIQTSDGSTIDNAATFPLNPSNTSYFISTVNGWNSLGFGQRSTFSVTVLPPLDISAGGNITLTAQQAAKNIEQFIGNLAQNATIIYPAVPGIWEVFNNTTGAFTVSASVTGSGSSVVIPQGGSFLIYSDGTKMYIVGAPGVPAFPLVVGNGGTGVTSFTPYAVITGGTTAAGPLQNVVGLGSQGFSLTSNGAGALPTWQSNSMKSVQVFTTGTAQTYTKPAGVNNIMVECLGGGGSGGSINVTTTTGSAGGGGGAGGYCRKFISGAAATYTYTVGAGGTAGATGANPGNPGGATTFSTLSANGGSGGGAGVARSSPGISGVAVGGGTATGGDLNVGGENGDGGIIYTSLSVSGAGGGSYFSLNGGQVGVTTGSSAVGQGAGGYGCGGSGSSGSGVNANQVGGVGFPGVIFVWEFS